MRSSAAAVAFALVGLVVASCKSGGANGSRGAASAASAGSSGVVASSSSANATSSSNGGGAGGAVASSASTGGEGGAPVSAKSSGAGGSQASATASASSSSSSVAASSSSSSSGCSTVVSYGSSWIRPNGHPGDTDTASGLVTWDGACTTSGANSYATLSNGWKPYFTGVSGCVMALDTTCAGAPACTTRVSYGSTWIPPANHPNKYDDVAGRVTWDQACTTSGSDSVATLSNGWAPHFTGASACELSFEYTDCGGLYQNSVMPSGCADPGVYYDGSQYIVACTSGDAADAFPLSTSPDLVHWTSAGSIFPSARKPTWATGDFWAPEIHKVGSRYVAYFAALSTSGYIAVGAATASSPLGPFTDIGAPLVSDSTINLIDPTAFVDDKGNPYLAWKLDGNSQGKPTPIYGQALSSDGTSLTGSKVELITNDETWEGAVTEAPWVVLRSGTYYLFYSGNSYANSTYAVGVAKATSPLGPYTKLGSPILATDGSWVGPGHCSVVDTPAGDTAMVYHAWIPGKVNGSGDVRVLLVDGVVWGADWPSVPEAPSASSRPIP